MSETQQTAMARETAEIPAVAERLLARDDLFAAIVERIDAIKPRVVVFCGRGSSGHAGVYLRYLFEARLGMLASASAPSVVTAYERPPDMRGVLFVVISQSGRSPDLVAATQVARDVGALTLAIVNDDMPFLVDSIANALARADIAIHRLLPLAFSTQDDVRLAIAAGLLVVAVLQTLWVATGKDHYLRMTKFWGKLFLINFIMGVATGLVQEFQFGMAWSEYSRFVGDVFGSLLALEALLAFFLESTFLGLWIFGWGRIPKKLHLAALWAAVVGSIVSAYFIIAANSWMQHPVGYEIIDGRPILNDIGAVLTNSTAVVAIIHTLFGAIAVAGSFLLGIAWYKLWRRRADGLDTVDADGVVVVGEGDGDGALARGADGRPRRTTDRAGGIEAGMSTGELLRVSAAMKPIATVPRALPTVDVATGAETTAHHQRSDVAAVPAAGIVAEAMVALVLADAMLEKFGGDSVAETRRNLEAFQAAVPALPEPGADVVADGPMGDPLP